VLSSFQSLTLFERLECILSFSELEVAMMALMDAALTPWGGLEALPGEARGTGSAGGIDFLEDLPALLL
jgi:hypothetical protein